MPLLIIGAVLGLLSTIFLIAYLSIKNKKEVLGFDRNMKDTVIIKRLLSYAKPYYKSFIVVFLLMAFCVASDIILPLITGSVTKILGEEYFEYIDILKLVIVYILLLLMSVICSYIQAILLQKVGQKIVSKIREELFINIESLSHNQLNNIPVGKLVTRVSNDTDAVSHMFTGLLVNLVKNVFMILGVIIAMFLVNTKLALIVMAFAPFIVFFTVIFRKFSRKAYREVKNNITDINTFLSENLSGIKITQIFNQEEKKLKDFNEKNNRLAKSSIKQMFVFSIFRPSVYMLNIFATITLFYVAGNSAIDGIEAFGQLITYSTIIIFYQYLGSFFTPIQNLAEQFNRLQAAFASSEKIFTIMDMLPEVIDEEDAIELNEIKGEIEFKDVWFSYIKDEWVLKGVSFKVNPKETVALVGSTGSGKSTILSLIVRNYDIQKGQILIDGIDIKKIKISSLRKHFGQMLQDVFIFSGTIKSNIVLREETITDEDVKEACDYVNASHFINKLEKGLDDEVLERGNNFSSGQRQLLSFARTIAHKPEVMILDEATANIDTETEKLIQDSLEKMMNVGTMLIVAHRLSTIQHADKIIVLSHGEILEQGNHQELLKKKRHYYNLYSIQLDKDKYSK